MNAGNNLGAFKVFRNVARMLKEEDYKHLMDNGISEVEKDIAGVTALSDVDHETTRILKVSDANKLLSGKIGPIFRTLFARLHAKGYLEEQRRQRIAKPDFNELENED